MPNSSELARDSGVPASRQASGRASRSNRESVNLHLDASEERKLCRFLDILEKSGIGISSDHVSRAADSILSRRSNRESLLLSDWVPKFLIRHPKYLELTQRASPAADRRLKPFFRALEAHHQHDSGWKRPLSEALRPGFGKPINLKNSKDRDYVTVVEAASAAGHSLSPMIVSNAAGHREPWSSLGGKNDYFVGLSDSGYTTGELALEWVKHFDRYTSTRQIGEYRLLLFDGHDWPTSYDFISYCNAKKIVPLSFPENTTYFLQPLDRLIFEPGQRWHGQVRDDAAYTGRTGFNQMDFLDNLADIRRKAFPDEIVMNSWRDIGLIPYDPTAVLSQIPSRSMAEEESCSSESSPEEEPPSVKRRRLDKSPEFGHYFEEKPKEMIDNTMATVQDNNVRLKAAETEREERRRLSRELLQEGGSLYVWQANQMMRQRDNEALAKGEAFLSRAMEDYGNVW